ncbi:MAG: hypothetical protein FJW30_01405 [Acidobacteria bacterium]|nr:hypothetical protein [Acidobacteriota bacterium]
MDKPNNPNELIAFGPFRLDPSARLLKRDTEVIPLAPKTFDLLLFFAGTGGRVVTKKELMDTLWKDVFVEESSLLYQVSTLRKALGEDAANWIETVPKIGYRFTAPIGDQVSIKPPPRRWTRLALLTAGLVLAAGAFAYRGISQRNWARTEAIPRIASLAEEGRFPAAFALARKIEPLLGDDAKLAGLRREVSRTVNFDTEPSGAEVFYRDIRASEGEWRPLGTTPLRAAAVPRGYFRLRFEKPGFEPTFALFTAVAEDMNYPLYPKEEIPPGMVPVSQAVFDVPRRFAPPERARGVSRFLIDRYEVTNRQFKEFVDAGGYKDESFWEHPFAAGWERAMAAFVDTTGRPGPATWIAGTIPPGREDFPVSGVSWYEAAAYAKFAGKQLPTAWHWYAAARLQSGTWVMPSSNFSGKDAARVGEFQGEGPFGTFDMAGNVKEWVWNEIDAGKRMILGGAWSEPAHAFLTADARSPFDRSNLHGFRCVRYAAPPPATWLAAVHPVLRNPAEKPASAEIFAAYRNAYAYDRTDLAASVDQAVESLPYWRRERVSYTAPYGSGRISALLFLPKNAKTPYQTVVYYPGAGAMNSLSSETTQTLEGWARLEYLLRAGRAVMYPIYQGSYERRLQGVTTPLRRREMIVQQVQDMRRAIDYLQTRSDIAADSLAFFGVSVGASLAPIPLAVEDRLKAGVLADGGLYQIPSPPEVDPLHFAPRVTVPVLMLNGNNDYIYPLETSQKALLRLFATPESNKKHLLFDAAHEVVAVRTQVIRELLDWLDQHQGPVRSE